MLIKNSKQCARRICCAWSGTVGTLRLFHVDKKKPCLCGSLFPITPNLFPGSPPTAQTPSIWQSNKEFQGLDHWHSLKKVFPPPVLRIIVTFLQLLMRAHDLYIFSWVSALQTVVPLPCNCGQNLLFLSIWPWPIWRLAYSNDTSNK